MTMDRSDRPQAQAQESARSAKTWLGSPHSLGLVARHARIFEAAEAALGRRGAVAFLNHHHPGLRGRPLDLAVASAAGLEAVEAAICVEARRGLESC